MYTYLLKGYTSVHISDDFALLDIPDVCIRFLPFSNVSIGVTWDLTTFSNNICKKPNHQFVIAVVQTVKIN